MATPATVVSLVHNLVVRWTGASCRNDSSRYCRTVSGSDCSLPNRCSILYEPVHQVGQEATRRVHSGLEHEVQLCNDFPVSQRPAVDLGAQQHLEDVNGRLRQRSLLGNDGFEVRMGARPFGTHARGGRPGHHRAVHGPPHEQRNGLAADAHEVSHREGRDCRGVSVVQVCDLAAEHDVDEPMAFGLDHRVDVPQPVWAEHRIEQPADLAVPWFRNFTEEVLVLGDGDDACRDAQ